MSLLLTPAQAQDAAQNRGAVFLDSTWYMPNVARNADTEFTRQRIPHARRYDLDKIADEHPMGLKHMLPNLATFKQACEERGITRDTPVIAYDTHGLFSAPRALFTLKAFGHSQCGVLDGGLPRWISEGFPTESGQPKAVSRVSYELPSSASKIAAAAIYDYQDIRKTSDEGQDLVLDARPAGRFDGSDTEPRPGLSSGHMPNSISLPFSKLLAPPSTTDPSYKTLLPKDALRSVFIELLRSESELERILSGQRHVVTSCGSGMTAAVIWLALHVLGARSVSLYDVVDWLCFSQRIAHRQIIDLARAVDDMSGPTTYKSALKARYKSAPGDNVKKTWNEMRRVARLGRSKRK